MTSGDAKTWYDSTEAEDAMAKGHAPVWKHLIGLIRETDLTKATVLDFGCNQGGFLRLLYDQRPFLRGVGADVATGSIEKANALKGDLPLVYHARSTVSGLGETFDLVTSHEVIYLLEDIEGHAADIFNVLNAGGVYYAVTGCHSGNPDLEAWRHIVRSRTDTVIYDRSIAQYAQTFLDAGFEVAARKLGFEGFIPYSRNRWPTDYAADLTYYRDIKTVFRLVKPPIAA
ncbi:class I SAM-dependent methyltransferase [Aliirhizobium smilacinae]|uniref:Class I SAM-dependent methyltransferase n=1 Tax=Aliirhizobium smilacinae TaxID=1395944 RepID=A0A5C4XM83_9HYPH|nr:class I SAM-dependent methyltransferase [Rhizobium smilacinae]TNM63564.1 class I SAM-dependent methyltransferase [Rhizobium smilacinae]